MHRTSSGHDPGLRPRRIGTRLTRVEHECIRGNTWAGEPRRLLADAHVDRNETTVRSVFAYEIGWQLAAAASAVRSLRVAPQELWPLTQDFTRRSTGRQVHS